MTKKDLYKVVEARLHNYKNLDMEINRIKLDIESYKAEFIGCKAIEYSDDIVGPTNKFNSSVENEVLKREQYIIDKSKELAKKQIEKKRIENALTCLDSREEDFFNLYFNNKNKYKYSMVCISLELCLDRKTCYLLKDKIIYKMMDMLYPKLKEMELPLFKMENSTLFPH
ncbi:hypothetical protein [Metaclostridioides mangenotii]|uniref:hypothetical protein n=1 Tax=Metaclostridioides mangenotii TaxID=1540 RepID=UPI0026E9CBEA|nr:hypothetical protein [Clostridioides mangenotii]